MSLVHYNMYAYTHLDQIQPRTNTYTHTLRSKHTRSRTLTQKRMRANAHTYTHTAPQHTVISTHRHTGNHRGFAYYAQPTFQMIDTI